MPTTRKPCALHLPASASTPAASAAQQAAPLAGCWHARHSRACHPGTAGAAAAAGPDPCARHQQGSGFWRNQEQAARVQRARPLRQGQTLRMATTGFRVLGEPRAGRPGTAGAAAAGPDPCAWHQHRSGFWRNNPLAASLQVETALDEICKRSRCGTGRPLHTVQEHHN